MMCRYMGSDLPPPSRRYGMEMASPWWAAEGLKGIVGFISGRRQGWDGMAMDKV